MDATTAIGTAAAALTTFANLPQLWKCWTTGSTSDLSLKTFLMLFVGVVGWAVYGWLKQDWIVLGSNLVGTLILAGVLFFKLREMMTAHGAQRRADKIR